MTIKQARKNFDKMKSILLENGKIDWTETDVLLEFIEPYIKANNKKFVEFRSLLLKYREDGIIDETESRKLIEEIQNLSRFLKVEYVIEMSLTCCFVIGFVLFLFCKFL